MPRYEITFERTYNPADPKHDGLIAYAIYTRGQGKPATNPETGLQMSHDEHPFLMGFTKRNRAAAERLAKDKLSRWMDKNGITEAKVSAHLYINETKNKPKH
jgi:hypothetical protein